MRVAIDDTISARAWPEFAPAPVVLPDFRPIVEAIAPRRTGEEIWLYLQRTERAVNLLRTAAATPGNPLWNYLYRLQRFTPEADRPEALRSAARTALWRAITAETN